MPKSIGEGWLNTEAAARRLGVTTRTLYRFIDEGQLPAYKFGRVIRLREIDLEDFIEASRVQPGDLATLYPPRRTAAPRKPRPRSTDRDAEIVAAYQAGGTVDGVASQLHVNAHTVVKALDAAGIERSRGQRRG